MEGGPSREPSAKVITTVMHLCAVSVLSFCLARRSFFHVGRKQLHPAIRSSQVAASAHERSLSRSQVRPFRPGADGNPWGSPAVDTMGTIGSLQRWTFGSTIPPYTFHTTCARFTAFLTLITSLLFALCSAIVVIGIGLDSPLIPSPMDEKPKATEEGSPTLPCQAVIYLCILMYGLTKIFVYLFLVERVYLVSSAGTTPPRLSTRTYKAGIIGISVYIGIIVLLLVSRTADAEPDTFLLTDGVTLGTTEVCMIGARIYGAVPLIIYEVLLTVVLTAMFVIPLARSTADADKSPFSWARFFTRHGDLFWSRRRVIPAPTAPPSFLSPTALRTTPASQADSFFNFDLPMDSPECPSSWGFDLSEHQGLQTLELRRLAKLSLLASFAGLATSTVNLVVLASKGGREDGATCMRWCLADVVINALAIYAVMQGKDETWWIKRAEGRRRTACGVLRLPSSSWSRTDLNHPEEGVTRGQATIKVKSRVASDSHATASRHIVTGSSFDKPSTLDGRPYPAFGKRARHISLELDVAGARTSDRTAYSYRSSDPFVFATISSKRTLSDEEIKDGICKGSLKGTNECDAMVVTVPPAWPKIEAEASSVTHSFGTDSLSPVNESPEIPSPMLELFSPRRISLSLQVAGLTKKVKRRWSSVEPPPRY